MRHAAVTGIEVLEDFSATARCDEGFLRLRRLRARNLRADGSTSQAYRIDVIDRPRLDAVAVLITRRSQGGGLEFLTRMNLRPAAYFRKDHEGALDDGVGHLYCEEIVAGLLEPSERGEEGLRERARAEVFEEAGLRVEASAIERLGPPFFVAPGILSEKIFLCTVDVTGLPQHPPQGDGSPLEEAPAPQWRSAQALREAIASGALQDAKTQLALDRFERRESAAQR